jgi:prepilin peptidase CpaA
LGATGTPGDLPVVRYGSLFFTRPPTVKGLAVHHATTMTMFLAGGGLLAYAAAHDIGFRTVPNWVSVALAACGLALRLLQGDAGWGLACGAMVFCCAYAAWWRGWMGGADVKLLGAAAVFVAPPLVPMLIIATSLAGGILALAYLAAGHAVRRFDKAARYAAPSGEQGANRPAIAAAPRRRGLLRRAARCELRRLRRLGPLPYATAIAAGGWLAIFASAGAAS